MATYKKQWDTQGKEFFNATETKDYFKKIYDEMIAAGLEQVSSVTGQIDWATYTATAPVSSVVLQGYTCHKIYDKVFLKISYYWGGLGPNGANGHRLGWVLCGSIGNDGTPVDVYHSVAAPDQHGYYYYASNHVSQNFIFKSDSSFWMCIGAKTSHGSTFGNIAFISVHKSTNSGGIVSERHFSTFDCTSFGIVDYSTSPPSALKTFSLVNSDKNISGEKRFIPQFTAATTDQNMNAILNRVYHQILDSRVEVVHDLLTIHNTLINNLQEIDIDNGFGVKKKYIVNPTLGISREQPRVYNNGYVYLLPWYDA